MWKTLERINNKFIKRPILRNLHKFVTCIKMLLYGIRKRTRQTRNWYVWLGKGIDREIHDFGGNNSSSEFC